MSRPAPTDRHPVKTSRGDSRRWNLLTTLQTIAARGSVSRADIARATGLTRASVSTLVADLIADGLVLETGTATAESVGKPATLLAIDGTGRQIVAVDLGHQPFRAGLVDLAGRITHLEEAPAGVTGLEAVDEAANLIARCLEQVSAPLLGIGVSTPGMLDPEGTVRDAAHLDWHDLPLERMLSERFDPPVTIGNDAHLAALAEFRSHPDGADTLLLVTVGEGIGAGLVLDGILHTGDRLSSGEIGHVVVEPDGAICRCGLRGCLETVAAVPVVLAAGNTREAAAVAGRRLGAILAIVISAIDVNRLVVASELTSVDGYLDAVSEEVIQRMHRSRRPAVSVTDAKTPNLGLAGAAAAVMRAELGVVLR